jgi:MFS family permease
VQTYAQLILLRLIIGFFDAAVFIGVMKLLFDWFPQHRRGFVVGLILAAYSLAITMDFALGIPLILSFGWRVFFAALAGGTLVVAAVVMIVGRATPATIGYRDLDWGDDPEPTSLATREIFRSKWVLVAGFGIAACTFAIAGTATWVVPAFIAEQGMPVESAGLIGTMMGLSQVVFLVLGGILADKVAKSLMIRATAFLALLVALMFLTSTLYPLSFGVLVVYAGLSGVAVLGGGAVFALMSEKYPVALAPAAIGFAEVFGILSSFAAPALMGAIISRTGTFFSAFLAFAIAEAVLVAILVVIAREPSGQKSGRASYGPSL